MNDDLADIRQREAAATQGPWHWFGNTKTNTLGLGYWRKGWGRCTVMDFTRWGMQSAQPRFSDDSAMMHNASEKAVWEVNRKATNPRDPSLYRHDVVGIRHPDAEFIAHAREDVARLLSVVDKGRSSETDAYNEGRLAGLREGATLIRAAGYDDSAWPGLAVPVDRLQTVLRVLEQGGVK